NNTAGNIVWHRSKPAFVYSLVGKDRRISSVLCHELGSEGVDELLMHEPNQLYQIGIHESSSLNYLLINKSGHDSDEWHFVDVNSSTVEPTLVTNRRDKIKYVVSHHENYFYISTNDNNDNFRLVRTPIDSPAHNNWQEYIPAQDTKYLKSFSLTKNYLILNYKVEGLDQIVIHDITSNAEHNVSFSESAYKAKGISTNFIENDIRINYSSLGRPSTIYSYDFTQDGLTVLKT
ncbi:MAG: hypothetical protein V4485_04360, partial [Pseudomonadota bacterium]